MARQIDDSKPLSDEDRQWLKDWSRDAEIARIDAIHGTKAPEPDESAADDAGSEDDRLSGLLRANSVEPGEDPWATLQSVLSGRSGDPLGKGQEVVAPGESGSYAPPVEDDDDEDDAYSDLTVEELRDELGNRELSKSGNKKELIARLRQADADDE